MGLNPAGGEGLTRDNRRIKAWGWKNAGDRNHAGVSAGGGILSSTNKSVSIDGSFSPAYFSRAIGWYRKSAGKILILRGGRVDQNKAGDGFCTGHA